MKIIVVDYSGFCFGVKKAVSAAYGTEMADNNIFTYGPLIHNSTVVNELEQRGIKQLTSIDELKENDTVIIRSHGVSKEIIRSLYEKKVSIVDATCPFVSSIHKKVEEYYNRGYQVFIIGDPSHPEIQGVNGWCEDKAIVINPDEEIKDVNFYEKICIVAQTTLNLDKWKHTVLSLLEKSGEIVIFNTICTATEQRQKSAAELAQKADAIIVLGGYNSSNTKKLVEICSKYCPKVFHIENINELNTKEIEKVNILGITAGASTPDCIIKEAIDKMNNFENANENIDERDSLMDEYEKTLVRLHTGDIVKGKIISVNNDEASVNIGYKADGIITRDELSFSGDISPRDILKPDDEIEVYVLQVNDGEGNVLLSKKRVDAEKSLDYIEECYNNKTIIDARVAQIVKGGIITEVKGANVFIPASQIDVKYVEDLSVFSGKTLSIVIITLDLEKNRIVGSRRAVLEEELKIKRKESLDTINAGDILSGTVSRITDFGVFIDLGGIDGLIHISELSWSRIKHPSEVVNIGSAVEVYVISVDKEKERISLSLKKTVKEPWENIDERIHAGDMVDGKVLRIAPFGAFIEIEKGVDGLLHISQISNDRVNKVEDYLKVGDTIKVRVMELNISDKKISLSMKEPVEALNVEETEDTAIESTNDDLTIGDLLNNK